MCDESFAREWDRKRHEKRSHGAVKEAESASVLVSQEETSTLVEEPRKEGADKDVEMKDGT